MIANMIKFETRGQGVSKIALLGKGEELLLTNTFLQWQARTKTLEQKPKSCLERILKE